MRIKIKIYEEIYKMNYLRYKNTGTAHNEVA